MGKNLTGVRYDWRQLPFIIVAGILIGVLFGQAGKALMHVEVAKAEKMKLLRPAKRTG